MMQATVSPRSLRRRPQMQISIKYQPSYSLAILALASGESIQAESGAMVSMSSNIQIETAMKGGMLGAVARKVLAVSYTHLRAHETPEHLVCRLLLEKKK